MGTLRVKEPRWHLGSADGHGLGELVPARHAFTTAARRQTSQPDVRFRRARLPEADVDTVDGLPVTTIGRTVHDLDHLADLVKDAFESGTRAFVLATALEPGARRYRRDPGQAFLADLLDAAGHRPDPVVLDLYDELQQRRRPAHARV